MEELNKAVGCAAALNQLHPLVIAEWLERQLAHRIIGQPRSVTGGCLATFLAETTKQMWCVGRTHVWLLSGSKRDGAPLPDFAVAFVVQEDEILDARITVAMARLLLQRVVPASIHSRSA